MCKISFVKFQAFEVCFLGLEEEPFLQSYFIECITFTALEICETECNMLEIIILVQGFSPRNRQSPPLGPKVLFLIERCEYYRVFCRRGSSVHVSQCQTKFIRLVVQKILGNYPKTLPLSQRFALTKRCQWVLTHYLVMIQFITYQTLIF